jgi:recombinational DNA repair protein RecT
MAKKTAFRRLFKWLPSSVEQRWGEPTLVAKAMAIDDAAAAGTQRLAIESGLAKESDAEDAVERMRSKGAETPSGDTPRDDDAEFNDAINRDSGELFPQR